MTMTNVGGVQASYGGYVDGAGAAGLSPDALLEYCQSQLGSLDGEIKNDIKQQQLQLNEREAAEQVQSALEQFGDQGPTSPDQMQTCIDAYNKAIASLPQNDPVAAELAKSRDDMCTQYGFTPATPGRALTATEQQDYQAAILITNGAEPDPAVDPGGNTEYNDAAVTQANYVGILHGSGPTLTKPPQNNDWKGTTDALSNIVGDIKSNAEIQMLQLQDLVSQRQQALSIANSMMGKEDQGLEQLARLGQG
jgi:hypothetical protein